MTRQEIEGMSIGQKGVYEWSREYAVCRLEPVREVLVGPNKGKVFRYVEVDGFTCKIGFVVKEE